MCETESSLAFSALSPQNRSSLLTRFQMNNQSECFRSSNLDCEDVNNGETRQVELPVLRSFHFVFLLFSSLVLSFPVLFINVTCCAQVSCFSKHNATLSCDSNCVRVNIICSWSFYLSSTIKNQAIDYDFIPFDDALTQDLANPNFKKQLIILAVSKSWNRSHKQH